MKTRLFTAIIACFIITNVFSQSNLNDYKYVIVPKKFDFLKEENKYLLNSLTKFLFEKNGFKTVMEGEQYPEDLATNVCMGLSSDVEKGKGMFKTKLTVVLKNCQGGVIYTSEVGESRIKQYDKAYNEALRNAFKSFETVNYKYVPKANNNVITPNKPETQTQVSDEIKKLKEEIQSLKEEKKEAVKTNTNQIGEVVEKSVSETDVLKENVIEGTSNILYAQKINNGFQLVDSSPKVVYRIKETGANNVFLVENKSAIIYKNGDTWVLEFYSNGELQQETLNIKF